MPNTLIEQVRGLGFQPAGSYQNGSFVVSPEWTGKQVVYLWAEGREIDRILRVGIACGKKGFGSRYKHYNRWLAGVFKAHDVREQKVRSVFKDRLHSDVTLWAREVRDKAQALLDEKVLRARFGLMLDLDLMVKGGWGALQMAAWRAAGCPPVVSP